MDKLYAGLGIAGSMIFLAVANAVGAISETGFDIGLYSLLAASAVAIGGGKCRGPFAR